MRVQATSTASRWLSLRGGSGIFLVSSDSKNVSPSFSRLGQCDEELVKNGPTSRDMDLHVGLINKLMDLGKKKEHFTCLLKEEDQERREAKT